MALIATITANSAVSSHILRFFIKQTVDTLYCDNLR
jgi:hypothetical protein